MRKADLRKKVERAAFSTLKKELPGLRVEVHRRIAKLVTTQVADSIHEVHETSVRSAAEIRHLKRRVANREAQTAYQLDNAIQSLKNLQESLNGQEKEE